MVPGCRKLRPHPFYVRFPSDWAAQKWSAESALCLDIPGDHRLLDQNLEGGSRWWMFDPLRHWMIHLPACPCTAFTGAPLPFTDRGREQGSATNLNRLVSQASATLASTPFLSFFSFFPFLSFAPGAPYGTANPGNPVTPLTTPAEPKRQQQVRCTVSSTPEQNHRIRV